MSIRLIIVDDHPVVRRGLKATFDGSGIEVVGEAASVADAIGLLRHIPAQVLLLDIRLDLDDTLCSFLQTGKESPELGLLIYSASRTPGFISRAISIGAQGYVLKSEPANKLVNAIQQIAAGVSSWTREELRRASVTTATFYSHPEIEIALTHRESEILIELTSGKTNKEIAHSLDISYETVKEHVQHVLRKVGVSDRTQAAVWAVRNGLA